MQRKRGKKPLYISRVMNFPPNVIDYGLLVQAHFLVRHLFLCGQSAGTDILHQASTYQIDHYVRVSGELVELNLILARPRLPCLQNIGDMVDVDFKHHTKWLLALYNRARQVRTNEHQLTDTEHQISGIVFAQLVMYIEETRFEASIAPVFKLDDFAHLYMSRMELCGFVDNSASNCCNISLH